MILRVDSRAKYDALVDALDQFVENSHALSEVDLDPYRAVPHLQAAEELLDQLNAAMTRLAER